MDKEKLKRLIIEAVAETEGAEIYRCYSGRGMNNKECLGIDIDHRFNSYGILIRIAKKTLKRDERAGNEFFNLVENDLREDALGKGVIVYFPTIEDCYLDFKAETETAVGNYLTSESEAN